MSIPTSDISNIPHRFRPLPFNVERGGASRRRRASDPKSAARSQAAEIMDAALGYLSSSFGPCFEVVSATVKDSCRRWLPDLGAGEEVAIGNRRFRILRLVTPPPPPPRASSLEPRAEQYWRAANVNGHGFMALRFCGATDWASLSCPCAFHCLNYALQQAD